jgi:hypothetical protein
MGAALAATRGLRVGLGAAPCVPPYQYRVLDGSREVAQHFHLCVARGVLPVGQQRGTALALHRVPVVEAKRGVAVAKPSSRQTRRPAPPPTDSSQSRAHQ